MEGAAALRQEYDQVLERQIELKKEHEKQLKMLWREYKEHTAAYVATLPEPCYILSRTDSIYYKYDMFSFIGVFTSYAAAAKLCEERKQRNADESTYMQVISRQELLALFKQYDWAIRVDEPVNP